MNLAVASGKGGTGKTTVAVNLARSVGMPVQLLDCDVEEPNAHLFLKSEPLDSSAVSIPVPRVDEALCDGCGECADVCQFNAIAVPAGRPMLFPELCHGCGGCTLVCPARAITEMPRRIGVIETSQSENVELVQGRLDVGVPTAPPLIRQVIARARADRLVIIDAPPGTSCPVIAAVRKADYVVLVADPTPFGLHDLKLTVDMMREVNRPFGVLINRAGAGDDRVHRFCADEGIDVLLEIPDDRRVAEGYSRGQLVVDVLPEYRDLFGQLLSKIASLRQVRI
jgi:MinD superfamily P-loop ATPase